MPSAKKLRGRQKKASKKKSPQRLPQSVAQSSGDLNQLISNQQSFDLATPDGPVTLTPETLRGLQEDMVRLQSVQHSVEAPGEELPPHPAEDIAPAGLSTEPAAVALTKQAVLQMYRIPNMPPSASVGFDPVVQVLGVGLKHKSGEDEYWNCELSDGNNSFRGVLVPSLAHLVHDTSIKYSILRILKFTVKKREGGGRYCLIFDAEVAGPNPGSAVGSPFWLTEDVLERIEEMDREATSHASRVLQQINDNFEEAECLIQSVLSDRLLEKIGMGFSTDCLAIKEQYRIDIMLDWFEILASIVRVRGGVSMITLLSPVLNKFLAPAGIVPETEYYGTTINYFMSVAKLFKIVSVLVVEIDFFPRHFFKFACGAVFWNLDRNTNPEVQHALRGVCDAGSAFIRQALGKLQGTSLEFTDELLSIANMRVCPGDSTFRSSLFVLIKEAPSNVEMEHLVAVLRFFVDHDCVDRDMIRSIVELADFAREHNFPDCWDCLDILYNALNATGDHHGSSDRRMSIAVDEGLIQLIQKMGYEEVDAIEAIVYLLAQGVTRWSKLSLSMARVDLEELADTDVDEEGPFSHQIEELIECSRVFCTRRCTCCAASLAVGSIFRCGSCGTVYCSPVCQVCGNRCVWSLSSLVLNCYL